MKIVVVSTYFSQGMGYAENCLPKALAALGHDVHVVTSNLNVYGNSADYDETYGAFLGPANQGTGIFESDGYRVHRLPSRRVGGYVLLEGLPAAVRALRPDVVHSMEIASVQTFQLAPLKARLGFKLFAETHQHLSVIRPYLKRPGSLARKAVYRLTRTLPSYLSSLAVERCYAIAPDCVDVARRFYGVPERKIKLQSLGTDTALFRPASTPEELVRRETGRQRLGFAADDVVVIYTGRFSADKNPAVLARALARAGGRFRGLFVGDGAQRDVIAATPGTVVVPFVRHAELADLYRAADVAVWPRQESMSMLDAAASGLPVVASDRIGERSRIEGNGALFCEDDDDDLAAALVRLGDADVRRALGEAGRAKMIEQFSWMRIAKAVEADFRAAGVTEAAA